MAVLLTFPFPFYLPVRCEDLGCLLHDCQQQIMKLEMAMEEFNSDRTMLDHIKEDVNRHLRYVLQR